MASGTERAPECPRRFEHGKLAFRLGRVRGVAHPQPARIGEEIHEQPLFRFLAEAGVVPLNTCRRQQFRDHRLVPIRALAEIGRGEVKPEHFDGADQRLKALCDERRAVVAYERIFDGAKVGQQFVGALVRFPGRKDVAQRLAAGQRRQRPGKPGIDADERAPIGLVLPLRALIARAVGESLELGGTTDEEARDGEIGAEGVHLPQVVTQRRVGLAAKRHRERIRIDVGIAVAVAADPIPHAEERRHRPAQVRLYLGVEMGDLREEGRSVVAQRVLDLVAHGQLGDAQHARLPQLHHPRPQQRVVPRPLTRTGEMRALGEEIGDRPFRVEGTLALHLGRVGGQDRLDKAPRERTRDARRLDAGLGEALEGAGKRAVLVLLFRLMPGQAAELVPVLGEVGEMTEITEGADDGRGLGGTQARE